MAYWTETTTVLDASDEWASGTRLADRHDSIVGVVFSDQGGTLHIEQSVDGENWDVDTSYSITANDGKGFSENLVAPFWRIRYVNGGSNQGEFRLSAHTAGAGDS